MSYKVMVLSKNSYNTNGTPIIDRECEHNHKTLSGACRCLQSKTKMLSDGMYSAAWMDAEIRYSDGSRLTEDELDTVDNIMYDKSGHK